jgi:hypothetical protein
MIIYRITNNINEKVYIGQTIDRLCNRWAQHNYNVKNKKNTPLYNAIRKYGMENFQIEEIGGANSLSELNYQEWLLIYKNNTLWPNGYNLRDKLTGKRGNNTDFRYLGMENICKKPKPGAAKKVIDKKTGVIYKSAADCARKNNINYGTLKSMLSGHDRNSTDFIYL